MTQLNQALEVIKDLSQVKARLMKDRSEIKSILQLASTNSDRSILPPMWFALNYVRLRIDELLVAIERTGV